MICHGGTTETTEARHRGYQTDARDGAVVGPPGIRGPQFENPYAKFYRKLFIRFRTVISYYNKVTTKSPLFNTIFNLVSVAC